MSNKDFLAGINRIASNELRGKKRKSATITKHNLSKAEANSLKEKKKSSGKACKVTQQANKKWTVKYFR
jgi:hypothetical protein